MKRLWVILLVLTASGWLVAVQALPPGQVMGTGPMMLESSLAVPRRTGDLPILSPEPDTLFYDSGTPQMFYQLQNQWACVRFQTPYALDLRSIYFIGNNPRNLATPCSIFVHEADGNALGDLLGMYLLPGNVIHFGSFTNPVWNDYTMPAPIPLTAGQEFFIVIGPAPGGFQHQGWHVLLDNIVNTGRSTIAGSHYGTYAATTRNFMIRAGVAENTAPPCGYISLISLQSPDFFYRLNWVSGIVRRLVFTRICEGTIGSVLGTAAEEGWTVANYADSIVFSSTLGLSIGSCDTFALSHPYCIGNSRWWAGDSSGSIDGPLPVELLSFEAVGLEDAVRLHWATASEFNNAQFEIWRSDAPDGEFRLVTRIPGRGNSQTQQDYDYTDTAVEPGQIYWYYLADVNFAGERTAYRDRMQAAAARNLALPIEFELAAYPNPFNPTTTLHLSLPEAGETSVRIYDVNGKQVRELFAGRLAAGRHEFAFDAADLPSGVYLAWIQAGPYNRTRKLLLIK